MYLIFLILTLLLLLRLFLHIFKLEIVLVHWQIILLILQERTKIKDILLA